MSIKFIDLGTQIDGQRRFAWWDDVYNQFYDWGNLHAWNSWEHFERDVLDMHISVWKQLRRDPEDAKIKAAEEIQIFKSLFPSDWETRSTEAGGDRTKYRNTFYEGYKAGRHDQEGADGGDWEEAWDDSDTKYNNGISGEGYTPKSAQAKAPASQPQAPNVDQEGEAHARPIPEAARIKLDEAQSYFQAQTYFQKGLALPPADQLKVWDCIVMAKSFLGEPQAEQEGGEA